ncbi:hypothetical protein [Clostridium gasigenes]|uniref:hypothetical protein n=1 Tax=Clostridium gasigenes TaxID=94869 RepID=UPI001C0D1D21|nr:hypothetical protein [Clostridium gasigenes]MBU3106115.1 hypothetical protein [Clostridium gasigenes]
MKYKNEVHDIEIWLEYKMLKLMQFRLFMLIMYSIAIITTILNIIEMYNTKPTSPILISHIVAFLTILLVIYIFFIWLPKLIKSRLRKKSSQLFKNKKIFSREKEIIIIENGVNIAYDNEKINIIFEKNTRVIKFKDYIFITKIIAKDMPIKIYPIIIPIDALKTISDNNNFIEVLKSKIPL